MYNKSILPLFIKNKMDRKHTGAVQQKIRKFQL